MKALLTPIHTGVVGIGKLRFFAPPGDLPEMPWFAVDDLLRCMVMSRDDRHYFLSRLSLSPWRGDIKAGEAADGPVTIAPHFVAQGLIDAMEDAGRAAPGLYREYAREGSVALGMLTRGKSPDELLAYLAAATRDDNDVGDDPLPPSAAPPA